MFAPSCWDAERPYPQLGQDQLDIGGPLKGWGHQKDCMLIFEELEEARSILHQIEEVLADMKDIPAHITKGMFFRKKYGMWSFFILVIILSYFLPIAKM